MLILGLKTPQDPTISWSSPQGSPTPDLPGFSKYTTSVNGPDFPNPCLCLVLPAYLLLGACIP